MCMNGLVYCLSLDCHFDIDGDSVDLLCRSICTTVVVSDWCITNLTI